VHALNLVKFYINRLEKSSWGSTLLS